MEDSRNPLTAGEIENLTEDMPRLTELLNRMVAAGPFPGISCSEGHELWEIASKMPRLLSLLPPPPDAAVREAVEAAERYAMPNIAFQELISTPHLSSKHLRTLLRAVQAPRLTDEQREADSYNRAHDEVILLRRQLNTGV